MKRRDMLWGVVAGAAAKAQTAANAGPQDDLAAFAVARDMEPGFVFEA
jgi:hypothetical protein